MALLKALVTLLFWETWFFKTVSKTKGRTKSKTHMAHSCRAVCKVWKHQYFSALVRRVCCLCQLRLVVTSGDRCKPFHKEANGYGRGEGVAAVALRPWVPRRWATRAPGRHFPELDGRSVSPSPSHQWSNRKACMAKVWRDGLSCGAMECHGTGTPTGDPIEVKSVGDIFGSQLTCLGALKGNINHTESAAGLAGFIKTGESGPAAHNVSSWCGPLAAGSIHRIGPSHWCCPKTARLWGQMPTLLASIASAFPAPTCMRGSCPCPRDTSLEAVQISDAQVFCWLPKGWNFDFVTAKV